MLSDRPFVVLPAPEGPVTTVMDADGTVNDSSFQSIFRPKALDMPETSSVTLSGGEQQRVALARLVIDKP